MLEHLLNVGIDWLVMAGGELADCLSTYFMMKKYERKVGPFAIYAEANDHLRNQMKERGIKPAIVRSGLKTVTGLTMIMGLAYFVDNICGIQENVVNCHHTVYLRAFLSYATALANLANGHECGKLGKALSFPTRLLDKTFGTDDRYTHSFEEALKKDFIGEPDD